MCFCCRDEAPALLWAGLQLGAAVDALCAGGARVVVSVSVCCLPYNIASSLGRCPSCHSCFGPPA